MTTENTDPEVAKLRAEISTLREQLNRAETDSEKAQSISVRLTATIKLLQSRLGETEAA